MKLSFLPPALVTFVASIDTDVAGRSNFLLVRIVQAYANDVGLLKHELTHIKQWWTFVVIGVIAGIVAGITLSQPVLQLAALGFVSGSLPHPLLYSLSRAYRQWAEGHAYLEQTKWPDKDGANMPMDLGAFRLALPLYDLGITQEQAKAYLTSL